MLFHQAKVTAPFESDDIGYRIGPRINAAGRMGSAADALELLLTRDQDRATELCRQLERHNQERRTEVVP